MMRKHFRNSEHGVALLEYAILLSLVALVCLGAVADVGIKAANRYDDIGHCLENPDQCSSNVGGCGNGATSGCSSPPPPPAP